ncbi:hypothetical protein ACE38V_02000 [Cytobacillus sp. Hz8]|uniref:hypothetical protein n=1 Tax=Cytobacillus sp. Hz8 TaxID=3347168 RepID=UPI0035E2416B
MKYFQLIFASVILIFILGFGVTNSIAFADDDGHHFEKHDDGKYGDYQGDHEKEGPIEEIGKMIGWGTAIAMGFAALLYPFRRSLKTLISQFSKWKNTFISFGKFITKNHVLIGLIALTLSILHGALMFLKEGELEGEGIIGLGSVLFIVLAAILGSKLMQNKKSKRLRTIHMVFISFALFLAITHIIA